MYVDLNVAHSFRKLTDSKNKGSTVFQTLFNRMLLEFFLVFNLFIPANIEKNQKKLS